MFSQKPPEKPIDNTLESAKLAQNSVKDRNRLTPNTTNTWSQQQLTPQNNSLTVNTFSNRLVPIVTTPQNQVTPVILTEGMGRL